MKYFITYIILFLSTISCKSQNSELNALEFKKIDLELSQIYQEYYEDRLDYGHEKDSFLPLFERKLQEALSKKEFYGMDFNALTKSNKVSVVKSKDKKLYIYSWDRCNMGSWKEYNSMYQYKYENQLYTGFLSEENEDKSGYINFSDGFHFNIYDIDANTYLVEGNGTHGQSQEFYTMRLLSFMDGKLQDCIACFDQENSLVFHRYRSDKDKINYDPEKKEISYLERVEDDDTGALKLTGKKIVLSYNNGQFNIKK